MPSREQSRTARLEARIAPEALAIVRRAAEIQGSSNSDFVVAAAQEAATRTITETEIIRLSVEGQGNWLLSFSSPPRRARPSKRHSGSP